MKNRVNIFVMAVLTAGGITCLAATNLYTSPGARSLTTPSGASLTTPVSSPIGSAVAPPSVDGTGVVLNALSQYGIDGNLLITGNVTGGRHFRGIVPYGSTTDFNFGPVNLGSSSQNSFIRRSAGQPYLDRSPGAQQPYYLPSSTVTALNRGTTSGLKPPTVTFPGGSGKFTPATPPPPAKPVYREQRPWSLDLPELEKFINNQLDIESLPEEFRQPGQLPDEKSDASDYLSDELTPQELTQELTPQELAKESKRLFDKTMQPPLPETPESLKEEAAAKRLTEQQEPSVFPDLDLLDQLQTGDEPDPAQPDTETGDGEQQQPSSLLNALISELSKEKEPVVKDEEETGYKLKLAGPEDLPEPDHVLAQKILGDHKNFKSLAAARFSEYIKAADAFMKEGKYYRAADTYILAGIWDSRHPVSLIGRAHALFAAGEYMSSAYYLARAFTIDPEYAKRKVDLIAIIGDKDLIENRIIEIISCQKQSESGELAFILAYVFQHTDRAYAAKQIMAVATQKLPDDPAVAALANVINSATNR